jgi:DNA-binding response OmpR family regulator
MSNFDSERFNHGEDKPDPIEFGTMVDLSAYREDVALTRVLVLEDDSDMRGVLKEYLESVPCEVAAVENGMDGLRRVLAENFDAIVCDMMMPGLAGDLFYLAVERTKPELCARFVFITGHSGNEKIRYFIQQIGGTILAKPFHMDDLRKAIHYVMRDAELRKAFKKPSGNGSRPFSDQG